MVGILNEGGLVSRCFSTGEVTLTYWNIDSSQQQASDGGTGLSSEAMRSRQSFVDWDFDTIWRLDPLSMDHPILAWQ